jgi:hypothetical protein
MIFAICGLTVVGTGTERAGTSSVWACAAVKPANPIAAHNSAVARSPDLTNAWIPIAGFFIAFSLFSLLIRASTHIATICARWTLPLQPHRCGIIPE